MFYCIQYLQLHYSYKSFGYIWKSLYNITSRHHLNVGMIQLHTEK